MPQRRSSQSPEDPAAGSRAVDEYLSRSEHPRRRDVQALRALVMGLDPAVRESVKWNAPSFALADHFATFRLHPPTRLQLVLHTGAQARGEPRTFHVDDPRGLLTRAAPDRCVLSVPEPLEPEAVAAVLRQWIAQL